MSRGKKFDAAQKHFEGEKVKYEKQIKYLREEISAQKKTISEQKEEIDSLSSENCQLKDWVERLLEYTELSKEEIKTACEKNVRLANAASLIGGLFSSFKGFY